MAGRFESIYSVIRRIPKGRVATYGQVARLAGLGRGARQVGYALSALSAGQNVPWHRVVNARGEISSRKDPEYERVQRRLLSDEGIKFDNDARLLLSRYQWQPRDP